MTTEKEVPIGAHKYRINRLPAFTQMNVATEYRDILVALAMLKRDRPKNMTDQEYDDAIKLIIMSRAGMTAERRTAVVSECLAHVVRHSGQGWSPILAVPGMFQFADIGLDEISKLLHETFEHNKLLDFFSVGPSALNGPKTQGDDGQLSNEERTG
jgi:hypothetical protein